MNSCFAPAGISAEVMVEGQEDVDVVQEVNVLNERREEQSEGCSVGVLVYIHGHSWCGSSAVLVIEINCAY